MLGLIVVLVIFGLGLYLINTYIPMAAPVKTILNVVVILILVYWLLTVFGFDLPIPHRLAR